MHLFAEELLRCVLFELEKAVRNQPEGYKCCKRAKAVAVEVLQLLLVGVVDVIGIQVCIEHVDNHGARDLEHLS